MKNVSIMLCIAIITAIGACKKDASATQPLSQNHLASHGYDFRDSLIGDYYITFYNFAGNGPLGPSTLTTNGSGIVTVSKLASDDSSIVLNISNFSTARDTLHSSSSLSFYCPQPAFAFPIIFASQTPRQAFFNAQKDSINYFYGRYSNGGSENDYFYCAGRKQ